MSKSLFCSVLHSFLRYVGVMGGFLSFCARNLLFFPSPPFYLLNSKRMLISYVISSMPVLCCMAFFSGSIVVWQSIGLIGNGSSSAVVSGIVAASVSREIAPVFGAIIAIAKVGSATALEVGGLMTGWQLDVLRLHGVSAEKFISQQRILCAIISSFVFVFGFIVFALVGSSAAYAAYNGESSSLFYAQTADALSFSDVKCGLIKSVVFHIFISCVSCFVGLYNNAPGKKNDRTVESAVVFSLFGIFALNYILTSVMY